MTPETTLSLHVVLEALEAFVRERKNTVDYVIARYPSQGYDFWKVKVDQVTDQVHVAQHKILQIQRELMRREEVIYSGNSIHRRVAFAFLGDGSMVADSHAKGPLGVLGKPPTP